MANLQLLELQYTAFQSSVGTENNSQLCCHNKPLHVQPRVRSILLHFRSQSQELLLIKLDLQSGICTALEFASPSSKIDSRSPHGEENAITTSPPLQMCVCRGSNSRKIRLLPTIWLSHFFYYFLQLLSLGQGAYFNELLLLYYNGPSCLSSDALENVTSLLKQKSAPLTKIYPNFEDSYVFVTTALKKYRKGSPLL